MSPLIRRLLYGIGAGISLAASSVALYLLLRDDSDEDKYPIGRAIVANSKETTLRIKVPVEYVGKIIGRQGVTIKKIQQVTNTRINFEDTYLSGDSNKPVDKSVDKSIGVEANWDGDEDTDTQKYRVVIIRGLLTNVQAAESDINRIINQEKSVVTEEIIIPTTATGFIIGKKGNTVREIAGETQTEINIATQTSGVEFTSVKIKGLPDRIKEARAKIDEIILRHNEMKNQKTGERRTKDLLSIGFQLDDFTPEKFVANLLATDDSGFVPVYVSAVRSVDSFSVQLAGPLASKLDQLMDKTTDLYEVAEYREKMKIPEDLKVGDVVVAPFEHDEHWYRVEVISIEEDAYSSGEAKVGIRYLDYGDETLVPKNQLCVVSHDLLKELPFQAIECELVGVVPINGVSWSIEAIEEFKQLSKAIQWTAVLAKPIETKERNKRKIHLIQLHSDGLNIAEELIKKGFAKPIDELEK